MVTDSAIAFSVHLEIHCERSPKALADWQAKFFAKINAPRYETSFYLLGWTPETLDALRVMSNLVASRSEGPPQGLFNIGGYSNPHLDQLIKQIQVELDSEKRNGLIAEGLTIVKEDFAYIPLHQQVVVWAARDNVDLVQTGNNAFQLRYVQLR